MLIVEAASGGVALREGTPGEESACLGRRSLFILRLHLGSCKVQLAWRRGATVRDTDPIAHMAGETNMWLCSL